MRASLARTGILGAVLAGFSALILAQYRIHRGLREDLATLHQKSREAAKIRKQNAELAISVKRLAASGAVRVAPAPTIGTLAANVIAHVVLDSGFKPPAQWKNNGILTARDATESFLWAIDRGEIPSLAGMLSLSDQSHARIASLFSDLTETGRAKYGSPEQMFALIYAYANPIYFSGVQVVAETPGEANSNIVAMKVQYSTGQIRQRTIPFTLSSVGWKRIVTDDEVELALKKGLNATP